MLQPTHKHPFLSDDLFRQVIETEVDAVDDSLSGEERRRCIEAVSERMQAELEEHLMTGDLNPDIVNRDIRREAERVVKGTDATAA